MDEKRKGWPFWAHVHDEKREAMWSPIFPDGIPVRGIVPNIVSVPGKGSTLAYFLAVEQITPEQRQALVKKIAENFNLEPSFVDANLDPTPILAEDTSVVCIRPELFL